MRILIDARLYGLEHAGLGRYVMNLVGELKVQGSEEQFVILLRKRYFNRLKFPKKWKKVLADFRHYSLIEQIALPKIINKENPDITHFPHFNVPILYQGKYVVTIHDLLMHTSRGKNATTLPLYKYLIKRFGYRLVFDNAVKRAVKVVTPSEQIKKEVVNYYKLDKKRVVTIYEGLSALGKNSKPQSPSSKLPTKYNLQKPYFIYVGNAYPHKNLERAIKAVVLFNKSSKTKMSFAIVSSRNEFTKRLKVMIKVNGAQEYVKLLGFVPDNKLGVLLKKSTAFIYPSLSEGFGLQGLESIACGTLVIASDIPIFREIYEGNVLYFNPLNVNSMVKAMKTVMKISGTKRTQIVDRGQKFIKRYSWAQMAKETLEIYQEAVGRS